MTNLALTPLDTLGAEIRHEHEMATRCAIDALGHARAAGEKLIEAKGNLKHGEWLPWLEANFPATEQTARNYMRVATRWAELESNGKRVFDLPLRDALKLLAGPREEQPAEEPATYSSVTAVAVEESTDMDGNVDWREVQRVIPRHQKVWIGLGFPSDAEFDRMTRAEGYQLLLDVWDRVFPWCRKCEPER